MPVDVFPGVLRPCVSYAIILNTTVPNVSANALRTYLQSWGWGDSNPTIADVSPQSDGTVWAISGMWSSTNTMNIGAGFQIVYDGFTPRFDTLDCVSFPQGKQGNTTGIWLFGCANCVSPLVHRYIPGLTIAGDVASRVPGGSQVAIGGGVINTGPTGGTSRRFDLSTVLGVQQALNFLRVASPPLVEDGIRGPKTIAAVKAFQTAHGIVSDGIVGPQTAAALQRALSLAMGGGTGAGAGGGAGAGAGGAGATGAAAPAGMSTGVMVAIGVAAVGAIGGLVWLIQKRKQAAPTPRGSLVGPPSNVPHEQPFAAENPRRRRRRRRRAA